MIYYINAIQSLVPNAQCVVSNNGYENIIWHDDRPLPSKELIDAELVRLQAEYDSKQYQRDRAAEYPDFKDYLDGIVKGDTAQVQAYIDACNAVKAKYPKG
jgi:hypothetical protein